LSRRESRRLLAQRRREAIEAARRAEAARQAALARQRAIDQGLKDETAANIQRDSTVGEDAEVRRVAVDALGDHAGTVVVLDPKTGRVYTVVNQDWALRRGYKPCSTIKLVTGVAGLTENVIDPLTEASGRGVDLTDSLAYSDNPFFQNVGGQVGFERIMSYARDLGLGERTGVNYANESPGRVPLFKSGYAVNHMCSHGDDFEVTPVQLATMVSAIANGGNLLTPHVPRSPEETVRFKTEVRRKINVPEENLRRMIPGMIGAVNYGTARLAYDPMQTVAGKTGTCIGQGGWLGLFVSYAPVIEPKLAVVVVTRGSGERGRVAASIAGKIYRGLNARFGMPTNLSYPGAPEALRPRPKIDPAAAIQSDEMDDDGSRTDVDSARGTTTTIESRGNVKPVLMPVPSRSNETRLPAPAPSVSPTPATPSASPAKNTPGAERPRRVGAAQP
jgi:membrane peptidoglycan carboxypeptidase